MNNELEIVHTDIDHEELTGPEPLLYAEIFLTQGDRKQIHSDFFKR